MAQTAIDPGEHLAEELSELRMSAAELARQLEVPTNCITEILNRPASGIRHSVLLHFFGTSAEFWLNLQGLYELRLAEQRLGCYPLLTYSEACRTTSRLESMGRTPF